MMMVVSSIQTQSVSQIYDQIVFNDWRQCTQYLDILRFELTSNSSKFLSGHLHRLAQVAMELIWTGCREFLLLVFVFVFPLVFVFAFVFEGNYCHLHFCGFLAKAQCSQITDNSPFNCSRICSQILLFKPTVSLKSNKFNFIFHFSRNWDTIGFGLGATSTNPCRVKLWN